MKIFISQLNFKVGDIFENTNKIIKSIKKAKSEKADIFISSELGICGYPPEDFLLYENFIQKMEGRRLRNLIQKIFRMKTATGSQKKLLWKPWEVGIKLYLI